MHRLQVMVSASSYEKLRSFAPNHGSGAIIEHMIERECQKREKRGVRAAEVQHDPAA